MNKILLTALACLMMAACGTRTYEVPAQYSQSGSKAPLYPDYTDIVVPANIAPLNFLLQDSLASSVVAEFVGSREGALVAGGDDDLKVLIDSTQWRQLLQQNRGADIAVHVYAERQGQWIRYAEHTLTVAKEDIDAYLSYRLIEPGYELYRQLGLYQTCLTTGEQTIIYENNRTYSDGNNHCINCHNYQNYSTENMLFHVRAGHGGTIFVHGDKAEKVQIKDETILTSGVYPSWHPKRRLVAFSTNKTGQTFHLMHDEKIEVLDEASDLLLYDVDRAEVRHILRTEEDMETFPCWAPDGKRLYYCSAHVPGLAEVEDSLKTPYLVQKYDSVYYSLMSIPFDEKTMRFGEPRTEIDCAAMQRSITVPRVSPDGRYVLYTLGDYGQFHIWHRSSDLWVKDLQCDSTYALTAANSPDVDSYHSWSSNGRWIVFSTRRMDGNYTRPFIAYFDRKGQAHKAFCIPFPDPEDCLLLLKSYNVPELTRDAVRISPEALKDCIYNTEGKNARYVK